MLTTRDKERRVLDLVLNENKTLTEAAEEVGYASASGASQAAYRAIRNQTVLDANELVTIGMARIESMLTSIWPIATANLRLAFQWTGKGKDREKLTCNDTPAEDDPNHVHEVDQTGYHVCYVVPAEQQLKAQETVLKHLERQSKYVGADFSDGIQERLLQLEEAKTQILVKGVEAALQAAELTDDQQAIFKQALASEIRNMRAKAIETTTSEK